MHFKIFFRSHGIKKTFHFFFLHWNVILCCFPLDLKHRINAYILNLDTEFHTIIQQVLLKGDFLCCQWNSCFTEQEVCCGGLGPNPLTHAQVCGNPISLLRKTAEFLILWYFSALKNFVMQFYVDMTDLIQNPSKKWWNFFSKSWVFQGFLVPDAFGSTDILTRKICFNNVDIWVCRRVTKSKVTEFYRLFSAGFHSPYNSH